MAVSLGHVLAQIQRWTSPRSEEISDAVLLERFIQRRDESAFAALVGRYSDMVLRCSRRVLGDAHEAEDVLQATFLVLARKAHTLRKAESLPGFLHSVARRIALKSRAKAAARANQVPLADELLDTRSDPLTLLTARELLTMLDEEVERLPDGQRFAVILCCLESRTQEDAARILGWTPGSLKGHLQRGRQRLQKRLERRVIDLSAALAVVAVSHGEAASALLVQSTVNSALSGGIGDSAAALAQSVMQTMFLPKLAGGAAAVLTIALIASTTVALVCSRATTEVSENEKPAVLASPKDAGEGKPKLRTDALGDPLPDGAISRLGTVRFRHGGAISYAAFTPDGKRLISKGIDGVRVWETASGKERWHIPLKASRGRGTVDLSPDGKVLATIDPGLGNPLLATVDSGPSNPVLFWDGVSGNRIGSLVAKLQPPIRFSPNGKWLAAVSRRDDIELWDLKSRKRLRSWNAHDGQVWSIDFSADSKKMLTSDVTGQVRLWDPATGRKLQEIEPLSFDLRQIIRSDFAVPTLSADGTLVAIRERRIEPSSKPLTEPKARISIWNTTTGKLARVLTCPSHQPSPGYVEPFGDMILAPDGKTLATTGPDRFLRFWALATGKELRRLPIEYDRYFMFLAISRDGNSLAGTSDLATIRILDVASGKFEPTLGGRMSSVEFALLTPDGRTAISAGLDKDILVWDAATGRVKRRLQGRESWIHSLQLSQDARTLYSTSWDKTFRIWDFTSGEERRRIKMEASRLLTPTNPIVSPDGKTLIVGDEERKIRILDMATGQERRHFGPKGVFGMLLTPDGRSVVGCYADDKVRLWDIASGRLLRDYPLPPIEEGLPLYSMALSPDGRLLAVGRLHQIGADYPKKHFLLLIDLNSGRELHHLDNLPTGVDKLVFSPDGHTLAWGGLTHPSIRLLETASGRERRRLKGHRGAVYALSFSADGRRLLSGSEDTTALVWDLVGENVRGSATAAELEAIWTDLAGEDAARADRAIHRFAVSPSSAVPFMSKHLHPVATVDEKRLIRLIADLDSDDFAIREKATADLQKLDVQALPAYRKALNGKPSLEMRRRLEDLVNKAHRAWWGVSGERLRSLRAIEALELAGTSEARQVLQTLAAGAEGAGVTQEAKAALRRSEKRGES